MREPFERVVVPAAVAAGGAIGSLARWGMASWLGTDGFSTGTFVTNLVGSFALGVVLVAGEALGHRQPHHRQQLHVRLWRPFMATGVLGGFTTFSTLAVEVNRTDASTAVVYLGVSLFWGLTCYAMGNALARRVLGVRA